MTVKHAAPGALLGRQPIEVTGQHALLINLECTGPILDARGRLPMLTMGAAWTTEPMGPIREVSFWRVGGVETSFSIASSRYAVFQ